MGDVGAKLDCASVSDPLPVSIKLLFAALLSAAIIAVEVTAASYVDFSSGEVDPVSS